MPGTERFAGWAPNPTGLPVRWSSGTGHWVRADLRVSVGTREGEMRVVGADGGSWRAQRYGEARRVVETVARNAEGGPGLTRIVLDPSTGQLGEEILHIQLPGYA